MFGIIGSLIPLFFLELVSSGFPRHGLFAHMRLTLKSNPEPNTSKGILDVLPCNALGIFLEQPIRLLPPKFPLQMISDPTNAIYHFHAHPD